MRRFRRLKGEYAAVPGSSIGRACHGGREGAMDRALPLKERVSGISNVGDAMDGPVPQRCREWRRMASWESLSPRPGAVDEGTG